MESRLNYAVLAVIVPVLIILQYALAAGFFDPDINMTLLLIITIVIVFIKTYEIVYLAIKTPPPPRPKSIYFVTGGIIIISVIVIYFITKLLNDTGNSEKLILGLFIVALVSQFIGTAAIKVKTNPDVRINTPKDDRVSI